MKLAASMFAIILALSPAGCAAVASHPATAPSDTKLDAYFQRYCGYTRNMGIGFDASQTYDFKYRQRLASTSDVELKRLFVLSKLYDEVDREIAELEEGKVRTGKTIYREMTSKEQAAARSEIVTKIDDLSRFDPGDPEREIAEFRARLQALSNRPATQGGGAPTARGRNAMTDSC